MKKLFFMLMVCSIGFSQETNDNEQKRKTTLSAELSSYVGASIGLTFEVKEKNKGLFPKTTQSSIYKFYYISSTLESDNPFVVDINGNGYGLEIGARTYFNELENKGFFIGGHIGSGNIKFEEKNVNLSSSTPVDFEGTYAYLTLFAPEVGYKFVISEKFAVSLHGGVAWLIEAKGKGDVDNKSFDNWVGRAGLSLGYNF